MYTCMYVYIYTYRIHIHIYICTCTYILHRSNVSSPAENRTLPENAIQQPMPKHHNRTTTRRKG